MSWTFCACQGCWFVLCSFFFFTVKRTWVFVWRMGREAAEDSVDHTVDGRNPAPPGMDKLPTSTGFQDFFHQEYYVVVLPVYLHVSCTIVQIIPCFSRKNPPTSSGLNLPHFAPLRMSFLAIPKSTASCKETCAGDGDTLRWINIAMEKLTLWRCISYWKWWYSIAMLVYQMPEGIFSFGMRSKFAFVSRSFVSLDTVICIWCVPKSSL